MEPIGIISALLGAACVLMGRKAAATGLLLMTLLGSATVLTAINIQPAHLFLLFVLCTVFLLSAERQAISPQLTMGRPGFWLACLFIYGIGSAFFFPRLMWGVTEVFPIGTSQFPKSNGTVPLSPSSGNFSQSIYLAADLMCFLLFSALASTPGGFRDCVDGMLATAFGFIFLAFIDLGTYATGMTALLDFVRNADYALLAEVESFGMKRIVGGFVEASSFARYGLAVVAFTGTLWLYAYRPRLTGALALVSLALVLLSTSSTGLVCAPLVMIILYACALRRCGLSLRSRISSAVVLGGPLAAALVLAGVLLVPPVRDFIGGYLETGVLAKSQTDSGVERGSWNAAGIRNFIDTNGTGAGLGSTRTSSLAIALVASVGVPGTFFFLVFLGLSLLKQRGIPGSYYSDARAAARNGCFGLLLGDLLINTTMDVGLLFCALAAIAAAEPERAPQPAGARGIAGAVA